MKMKALRDGNSIRMNKENNDQATIWSCLWAGDESDLFKESVKEESIWIMFPPRDDPLFIRTSSSWPSLSAPTTGYIVVYSFLMAIMKIESILAMLLVHSKFRIKHSLPASSICKYQEGNHLFLMICLAHRVVQTCSEEWIMMLTIARPEIRLSLSGRSWLKSLKADESVQSFSLSVRVQFLIWHPLALETPKK